MSLDRLLNAQSIAIVGASPVPNKASGMMLDFLLRSGYEGRVYPVNPRYDAIGETRCYASIDDLPETVDVAVLVLPVDAAYQALEAAGRRGVPFAILTTGGYGEGMDRGEGQQRRNRIQELCRQTGLRILGPNLIGLVNFRRRMPLVFADWYARDTGQRGGVAIVTHSGSVGGLIFSSLQLDNVGVDLWIATGNEAVTETADFLDHLSGDPELHTIACFMEGVMDGRRFMAAAEKARIAGKNVVVLKAGASPESRRSTMAHTCKQSTTADVYDAVLRQLGVVQVDSLPQLTQTVKLLAAGGPRTGGRIGLLSASGGACSVIADYMARAGLSLPILPAPVQERIATALPQYGSAQNPVDLTADIIARPEILKGTLEAIETDEAVDTWIVFGRPIVDRYHAEIGDFARRCGKTVVVCTGVPPKPEIEEQLQRDGVIIVQEPELCARALGAIHDAGRWATAREKRNWTELPRREPGDAPLAAGQAGALLARRGLKLTTGGAAGGTFVVSVIQDSDFGPLLVVRDDLRGRRSVRALPATASELRSAVEEVADDKAAALADIAQALADLYADDPALAEIEAQAVLCDGAAGIASATIRPAREQV